MTALVETILVVVIATAASVLAWSALRVGTVTLARWRETFTARARFQAREFFLFIDPRQLFTAHLATMALITVIGGLLAGSVWVAAGLLAASAALPRLAYRLMRRRRLRQVDEQLPDALLMLAGALRAGVGLGSALQQVVARTPAPLGQEVALLQREQRLGLPMDQALEQLARRVPTPSVALVVSALRVAGETGGTLAETLERTAATVRQRLHMEGRIDALTAQGRLQAWVVGALPLVLLAVLHRMEPQAMALLWTTPIGWGVLATLAFLLAMGVHLIRRIVAIDV
jgi:tight adherence protein B